MSHHQPGNSILSKKTTTIFSKGIHKAMNEKKQTGKANPKEKKKPHTVHERKKEKNQMLNTASVKKPL